MNPTIITIIAGVMVMVITISIILFNQNDGTMQRGFQFSTQTLTEKQRELMKKLVERDPLADRNEPLDMRLFDGFIRQAEGGLLINSKRKDSSRFFGFVGYVNLEHRPHILEIRANPWPFLVPLFFMSGAIFILIVAGLNGSVSRGFMPYVCVLVPVGGFFYAVVRYEYSFQIDAISKALDFYLENNVMSIE